MRDVHVHFLHGNPVGYNIEFFEGFIKVAQDAGLDEIYMLEHTHQFTEFERVYESIKAYNDFQNNWITKRMNGYCSGSSRLTALIFFSILLRGTINSWPQPEHLSLKSIPDRSTTISFEPQG